MVSAATEQLCVPSRRFRDMSGLCNGGYDPFEYTEVELIVPVQNFLIYYWDWKDLRAFLIEGCDWTSKILWITENAFLVVEQDSGNADFGGFQSVELHVKDTVTLAILSPTDVISTAEVSVLWPAIMTSKADLKVKLSVCKFNPQDAEDTFIEWFRHNQIITELEHCDMDSSILSALDGNDSVKNLTMDGPGEDEIRYLAQALPGNMGIAHLEITIVEMSDENCSLLIRSLATHPRITFLSVQQRASIMNPPQLFSVQQAKSYMRNAILQMLQRNTVVHTIGLPADLKDEAVYQNSVLPRLEMHRSYFEVQRQALKRADPSIRPQLLGRALHVVRYNPNLVFQFLSENVPA